MIETKCPKCDSRRIVTLDRGLGMSLRCEDCGMTGPAHLFVRSMPLQMVEVERDPLYVFWQVSGEDDDSDPATDRPY